MKRLEKQQIAIARYFKRLWWSWDHRRWTQGGRRRGSQLPHEKIAGGWLHEQDCTQRLFAR